MQVIKFVYNLLWGDLFTISLPNGIEIGISLLVLLLIPTGIYFTIRTKFLMVRFFPEMLRLSAEKKTSGKNSVSGVQALIVSTATRVGMGNLVGVVAALSLGGAGAVFWMWITALIGASTAFIEATLAQLHREPDVLYGGHHGGPAYYMHNFFAKGKKKSVLAILFALSGLICWGGISQVIGNSVTEGFYNAFEIKPIYVTVVMVILAAIIVLRKNATVKVLDVLVPIMAAFYFLISIFIIVKNISLMPSVFRRIVEEAFGVKQVVAGGFGAVLMNGVKRGLFSNEAGSGSAPCASASGEVSHPAKSGLLQAFGVFIDTIVICTCTAMIMLLAPSEILSGTIGIKLLQDAMQYHFGYAGVVFVAVTLALFCFSTFIGILYYARSNISYLFGNSMKAQTIYKVFALIMLFVGGLAAYTFVWDIGDIGVGLMTVFNIIALYPMSHQALDSLKDYTKLMKERKNK